MTSVGTALLLSSVVSGLVVLLLIHLAVTHVSRVRRLARDQRRRTELTPLVLDLLDEEAGTPARGLASAPAVLDDVVLELLPQLRGRDRAVLQQVLSTRGVIARAAADLTARAAWRRGRAASLLGSTASRFHTAELVALLGDRSADVRCAAARALGKAGDPAAAAPLLRTLSRSRPLPSGVVGMAVLDLGSAALPALRDALAGGAPRARLLAAELLGLHGDLAASAALEATVRDWTQKTDVRRTAAAALGRIGSPSSTEVLVQALGSSGLECAAAEALGRIGDPFAVPVLGTGLSAVDQAVRTACAVALAALGAEGRARLTAAAAGTGEAATAARAALEGATLSARRAQPAGAR